jgi:hypothetical protein
VAQLAQENRQPFWFELDDRQRQQAGCPWGPANPQALNRYAYVQNNPVRWTDPDGHCRSVPGMFDGSCFQEAMAIYLSPRATPGHKALGFTYAQLAMFLVAVGAVLVSEVALPAGGSVASALGSASGTATVVLNEVSRSDAREAIRAGINGLSAGQAQKALDALARGRVDSFTLQLSKNGQAQLIVERAGRDGVQRLIYTLDQFGKTIRLIQEAYNAAEELEHVHDKLNNIIIK